MINWCWSRCLGISCWKSLLLRASERKIRILLWFGYYFNCYHQRVHVTKSSKYFHLRIFLYKQVSTKFHGFIQIPDKLSNLVNFHSSFMLGFNQTDIISKLFKQLQRLQRIFLSTRAINNTNLIFLAFPQILVIIFDHFFLNKK